MFAATPHPVRCSGRNSEVQVPHVWLEELSLHSQRFKRTRFFLNDSHDPSPSVLNPFVWQTGLSDGGRISVSVQIAYNAWIAAQTHARGMGVAMKNNNEAAAFHVDDYDMVVNEECWINGNCANYVRRLPSDDVSYAQALCSMARNAPRLLY